LLLFISAFARSDAVCEVTALLRSGVMKASIQILKKASASFILVCIPGQRRAIPSFPLFLFCLSLQGGNSAQGDDETKE
jgi:hypothetical protein